MLFDLEERQACVHSKTFNSLQGLMCWKTLLLLSILISYLALNTGVELGCCRELE